MDSQVDDPSVLQTSKQTLSGIRELSIHCRDLLNQMSTLDSITNAADARDTMTSFNIWAANLGIFDEGRLSVAYRLKDAPQGSNLTKKLLIELERHLDGVITMIRTGTYFDKTSSVSESENSSTDSSTPSYRLIESSDDDEPLLGQSKGSSIWASIEDTMTGLRQLGLSIRLAGTQHRQERVARFKKQNEPMYDMFEHLARQKVDHNFPQASETLRERMAESIATRRVRFLYLEKHQNKISTLNSPEPALKDRKRIGQDMINSALSQFGNQKAEASPTFEPPQATGVQFSQILSDTITTKYNTKEIRPIQKTPERGGSVSSVVLNSALPPIPKLNPGGTSFICPFCFLVCPASEARGYERWKSHLIHDFEPFFCVYDECSSPFACSDTFSGLLAHMRDAHTKPKWRCWHCNTASSSKLFPGADELEDHLKNFHSTEVEDSLRSTVLEHSIVRAQQALRDCPFCGGFPIEIEERPSHQHREEALEKLEKHVREHLANVALILAPRETGELVNTMSDDGSEAKTGKNSERDFQGLGESTELECLNVSCDCHETEKDSADESSAETNSNNCEIEEEFEIKKIIEVWHVILERKGKEFQDDHESQLACAVKYGFSYGPKNVSPSFNPESYSTQKGQEEDMGHTASKEIKVWTHADYTVGWICVLSLELTAASAMLDQQHPDLPKTANDQNTYKLGSISGHNIVIACLPEAMIGDFSAGTVVTYMMSTFPSITWSLLVGIGAGVPSNDVRLGDIVVGVPCRKSPGVIMLDLGKAHGEPERMGTLTNTPRLLTSALAMLEAQQGSKISQCLEGLEKRWPRLPSSYFQSTSLKDLAFEADYKHVTDPEGEGEADSCRLCDKSMILEREPREMLIHHGLIASGNMVIKDAQIRDKLNNDLGGDVLCFETEAAGLGQDLPCLVIRGICDYADSHKNKDWRGHAAFVAAAFTNELLQHISPIGIESEKPVEDILSDASAARGDTTRIISSKPGEQDLQDLDWLTKTDYRLQQIDYRALRQPGTGYWLLETKEYRTWLATPGQILFCEGRSYSGKTILTSVAIDHLTTSFSDDSSTGLAYIYFTTDQKDVQTPDQLFACILKQLAQGLSSLPDAVHALFGAHQNGRTRPSLQKILIALQAVIAVIPRVFIVIDAVDENGRGRSARRARKEFITELARFQQQYGINVFATSRDQRAVTMDIEDKFSNLVHLVLQASDDDIARYIEANLSHLPGPFQKNRALRDFTKTVIWEAGYGNIGSVGRYLELLRDQTTETEIRHKLQTFKEEKSRNFTELQNWIHDVIQRPTIFAALTKQVLLWLTHARRELTLTELQHALDKSLQRAFSPLGVVNEGGLADLCPNLVTIDMSGNIVRLAHHGVRECLKNRSSELLPSTEQDIARTCIAYLLLTIFREGSYIQSHDLEEWLTSYPLYHYAATNWGHHARESSLPKQEVMDLLDDRSAVKNSIAVLMVDESSRAYIYTADPPKPESVTSLHLAAYFLLTDLVPELLSTAIDSDPRDSQGRTPLSYAAQLGHEAIVSMFLQAGAEADSKGLEAHENTTESSWLPTGNGGHAGRTPLSFAAEHGHVNTSKMLLDHGADPGSKCIKDHYEGWTPLLFALHQGHEKVVGLLLDFGADPEQPSMNDKDFGKTPLSHAVEQGHTSIVQMLLKQGVNAKPTIISTDSDAPGHTPLRLAAYRGYEAVIRLLLDTGEVQLDLQDKLGRTILSYMAGHGHETLVRLILAKEASVDLQDNKRRTPLSYAAEAGYPEVVRALLEGRADQYMEDARGETPRSRAIRNGNLKIIAIFEEST